MKRSLCYYGNSILRAQAKQVEKITPEIIELIDEMKAFVDEHMGLGLSAPQVGSSLAVFITAPPELEMGHRSDTRLPIRVFINPVLSEPSKETWVHDEACFSIPKLYAPVERPVEITVTAMDEHGNQFTERFKGWPARVIMHENDHLHGVLYIDRVPMKYRKKLEPYLKEIKKRYAS